jgi:Vitamin B12 dependent methionine synthase, activation domain/Homocysteine S-methyltransferase
MPSGAELSLLDALAERVLVADGAMGTMLQAADLSLDDFAGLEGCNEILNVTRPDVVCAVFKLGYRGARFSLGYGACPDLADREKIVALLDPEPIGVKLSEEFQLHPEQSTDAIVLHHPEAKYFDT